MIQRGLSIVIMMFLLASCQQELHDFHVVSDIGYNDYSQALDQNEAFRESAGILHFLTEEEERGIRNINAIQQALPTSRNEESFVFFIIGDSELNMRGNTYPQLEALVQKINDIEPLELEFTSGDFEEGESRAITKPELVLLAGDINKDRTFGFSLPGDLNTITKQETNQLFNQFDDDILFFAGNGNHDWDPYRFGDNSYGHNLGGLLSNLGTAQFVRSRYSRGLSSTTFITDASFNYDRNTTFFPLTSSSEFNYSLVYKGVRFTQLNQFLHQPVAMVSLESLANTGPAWYFPNRSSQWFRSICDVSAASHQPHVVVQHFPINTGDGWWNDDLGGTPDQLRKRYMDIFEEAYLPVMFSGHNHTYRKNTVEPYGIEDHTAGYFANGYVIAVKASASKGVYAITHVNLNTLETRDPSTISSTYTIPQ